MKSINAPDLHIADKRIHPEWHAKGIASLTTLAETVEREKPDLVTIPGDLWQGGIQNSAAAGFPSILHLIRRILDVCPIAAVAGTGSHDPIGVYQVLTALKAKHPFILLDPTDMSPPVAWICEEGHLTAHLTGDDTPKLMIMGIPEPTREWLLAGMEGKSPAEAAEKMKSDLLGILLGLGAIRAQYPDVPCVFLYHGAVAGTTMQNGQVVGPSDIVIGKQDLQLIASDITARYGGPGYHRDWGERGQVGFDMVELQPGDTYGSLGHIHLAQEVVKGREISVTRFDYPHPPRQKYVLEPDQCAIDEPIRGKQVWIVLRRTKEQIEHDPDGENVDQDTLEAMGALPGSRVTVELIHDEVRGGLPQIAELHTLREKIQLKAQADGKSLAETVLQKADQLERDAAERGELQRTSIVVKRLKLRGSKAVYKGRKLLRRLLDLSELPVDELILDLEKLDPGVVALIGDTGTAKTSIFKFLAPFTDMPGRRGPLRKHFRLRDSSWELTFLEEYSGAEFRVYCLIDGISKTGKCEYYLYRNGEPLYKGCLMEDYDEAVKRYFGTAKLFVRCTLVAQKATKDNPDLSEATEGERQAVVRELSGIGYYQAHAEDAKGKGDAIESEISVEQRSVSLIEGQLQALPAIREDRSQKAADVATRQAELRTQELRGHSLKSDAEQLAEKVKAQELLQQKIAGLEDQAAQKRQAIATAEELIAGYQAAVQQAPAAQKVMDDWTALKEREGKEVDRLKGINKERARLSAEHGNAVTAHSADVRRLEAARTRIRTEKARLEGDHRVLLSQAGTLQKEIGQPLTEDCPTCHRKLQEEILADLRNVRTAKEKELEEIRKKIHDLANQIMAKDFEISQVKDPPAPVAPPLPPADETALEAIRWELDALEGINEARESLATAQEAATRTEETRKQLSVAQNGLSILEINLKSAQSEVDPSVAPAHAAAKTKLEAAEKEYREKRDQLRTLEAEIKGLDARICELESQAKDLEQRRAKLAAASAELSEWRYLHEICAPAGLQAEELRIIGPKIADTANGLLSSVFGSRFSIEYRLDRMAGRGKDLREVPDFAIWIIDNEDGGSEQEFMTLSGGESVPVNLAIHLAFVKIREQKFSPMLIDEADGALSPRLRAGYVEMIEHARTVANLRNILVVSHDPGVQESITQRILMSELAKQEVAA